MRSEPTSQSCDRDPSTPPPLRGREPGSAGHAHSFQSRTDSRVGADAGPDGSGRLTPRRKEPRPEVPPVSGACSGSAGLAPGVMASRLLCGARALVAEALRARGVNAVAAVRSMASGGTRPARRARDLQHGSLGVRGGTSAAQRGRLLGAPMIALQPGGGGAGDGAAQTPQASLCYS